MAEEEAVARLPAAAVARLSCAAFAHPQTASCMAHAAYVGRTRLPLALRVYAPLYLAQLLLRLARRRPPPAAAVRAVVDAVRSTARSCGYMFVMTGCLAHFECSLRNYVSLRNSPWNTFGAGLLAGALGSAVEAPARRADLATYQSMQGMVQLRRWGAPAARGANARRALVRSIVFTLLGGGRVGRLSVAAAVGGIMALWDGGAMGERGGGRGGGAMLRSLPNSLVSFTVGTGTAEQGLDRDGKDRGQIVVGLRKAAKTGATVLALKSALAVGLALLKGRGVKGVRSALRVGNGGGGSDALRLAMAFASFSLLYNNAYRRLAELLHARDFSLPAAWTAGAVASLPMLALVPSEEVDCYIMTTALGGLARWLALRGVGGNVLAWGGWVHVINALGGAGSDLCCQYFPAFMGRRYFAFLRKTGENKALHFVPPHRDYFLRQRLLQK